MTDNKTDFTDNIATVASAIEPFHVMKILAEAKQLEAQGKDVIHMEIGEPDFPSPECVHDAAIAAAQKGLTHYTPTLGLPELRQKLAAFYHKFYNAQVDSNQIIVTPGSSSALQLVLTSILNPQDKVLTADPTYPCNRQFVKLLHADILAVPVSHETQYQLNLELIKHHWRDDIKAVMVASPANPTGTIIEQDELLKMAEFLSQNNAYLIVDEIYQGLIYDRPAESILAQTQIASFSNVIVINSFSKFFGMTGWRLGWTVVPEHLIPILDRLGQNLFLSAPTPSQYGALAVLEEDALAILEERRQIFEQRRNTLINSMKNAGFSIKTLPQGAFYLYWDVSDLTPDSQAFCSALLQETGVAITPGMDFGDVGAKQHVRIAYTCDEATILKAVDKIVRFCKAPA